MSMTTAIPSTTRRLALLAGLLLSGLGLAGCETTYSADIRNQTPQPLFAEIISFDQWGNAYPMAATRLGPGDRAGLGPVRIKKERLVTLQLDTVPNPQRPARVDMRPGVTTVEVTQQGAQTSGPLQVRELQ